METKNGIVFEIIPISQIHDDESFNCRGKIAPIDVLELAKDIKENGLHQPVVVSIYDDAMQSQTGKKFRLVAGFRRLMAHRVNGAQEIPAIIKPYLSEVEALKINLAENIQRQNLNILQEALAIKRMKDFGLSEVETSNNLGMSRGWVQVRFMLLSMPSEVQQEAAAGFITQNNIRDLYTILSRTGDINQIYQAVRDLKQGKIKAQDIRVAKTKQEVMNSKRIRKRPEIFQMMEHIQESGIGNGLWTRAMAWCSGEISTGSFIDTLQDYAIKNNISYVPYDGTLMEGQK